jgi:hypothetical protein
MRTVEWYKLHVLARSDVASLYHPTIKTGPPRRPKALGKTVVIHACRKCVTGRAWRCDFEGHRIADQTTTNVSISRRHSRYGEIFAKEAGFGLKVMLLCPPGIVGLTINIDSLINAAVIFTVYDCVASQTLRVYFHLSVLCRLVKAGRAIFCLNASRCAKVDAEKCNLHSVFHQGSAQLPYRIAMGIKAFIVGEGFGVGGEGVVALLGDVDDRSPFQKIMH